jgi:hypothetical protein
MKERYLLALLCGLLGGVGDAFGLAAGRGWHPRIAVAACALAYDGLIAPVWFVMTSRSGGQYAEPWAACKVVSVTFSCALMLASGDQQNRSQWLGVVLVLLGVLLRALPERLAIGGW